MPNGEYSTAEGDKPVNTYLLKQGAKFTGLCVGSGTTCTVSNVKIVDITFKRPNPDAIICGYSFNGVGWVWGGPYNFASITITGSDGASTRNINVMGNGQITVQ